MNTSAAVTELPGRAVEVGRFKHLMALALNPQSGYQDGVVRVITSREGDVSVSGFVDHSELHYVRASGPHTFEVGESLALAGEAEAVEAILPKGFESLGFEDPDLTVDESGMLHLYFTIPLLCRAEGVTRIYLGHAEGSSLGTLTMTEPALAPDDRGAGAKEVSLAPRASDGLYRHLVESSAPGTEATAYSTVRVAKAASLAPPWEFGETLFHPARQGVAWALGHASPGPFVPASFIDLGPGKLLGFLNGREADSVVREQVVFGTFSVGLFIYDYEHGEICWTSPDPLIQDREARTITFASQFVEVGNGKGILYAHVDDSFVRAYEIDAHALRELPPSL